MDRLAKPIFCTALHGVTNQEYEEGTLQPGTLIKDLTCWGEEHFCDPEAPLAPAYAQSETCTFLASTDGDKTWYRQRSGEMPVIESAPESVGR